MSNKLDSYLNQTSWRVKENSSTPYSIGGLILHLAGRETASYWLNNVYDENTRNAHKSGAMHIHDLSMLSTYCCGWSLRQLISEGLGGVEGKINSGPPKHLSTLVLQMVNFLGILQNESAGAQAFSSVDTYLAPFIKEDKLSYVEVKQFMQQLVFGLNVSSRWGSQSPFSNFTFDWVVPSDMKDSPCIVGGKVLKYTYNDVQKEMDMVNKAFLEVYLEGDSDGRTFAYPIPTYNITKDFDWDNSNCDLLFELTRKYGVPYFQNFISSDLKPEDVRSMCCRLQLDKRQLLKRGGGLFGSNEFTGSIGVVTINLPRLGYLFADKTEFYNELAMIMDIAKDSLELKRSKIQELTDSGLYPYTQRYLMVGWKNHFSTIGLIGMEECCQNLLGVSILDPKGKKFAEEVLDFMRNKCIEYQEETDNLYNLEATPAEGTSYRLAKHDKAEYKDIYTSGTHENPYYTNSTQLPVGCTNDIFEVLDHQESLQTKYTGGSVLHTLLGTAVTDKNILKVFIKVTFENYKIPYMTLSTSYSICKKHGYISGEKFECPKCGAETEVYARVTGYYRPVKNWNKGKTQEFKERVKFDDSLPKGGVCGV